MSGIKRKLLYALYLLFLLPVILEIALRIYNPFHYRLKGDKIVLDINKTVTIQNSEIPVLDRKITRRINALGFRGPEKPAAFERWISMLTAGGSTTECPYIADGKTWSDLLCSRLQKNFDSLWLNNAGFAGHSSFGNIALTEDYFLKIKPKIILYMEGANDLERNDLNGSDKSNLTAYSKNFFTFLSKHSELCNLIVNIIRARKATVTHLADHYIDLRKGKELTLNVHYSDSCLQAQEMYLQEYGNRIGKLISLCRNAGIEPVFITQATLFGEATDSVTGVNLATFDVDGKYNGELWWKRLELYNNELRKVCASNRVFVIDLAAKMPKSSAFFYDLVHFTNAGSQKVSEIIYQEMNAYLAIKYPLKYRK